MMADKGKKIKTEKPCEGCGIPAEYCEPNTCMILQAIKKAANIE